MAKSKNKSTPRAKRMNRNSRKQSAGHWLKSYKGKNLVQGYRKHFGVCLLQAASELQELGVFISPEYISSLKASVKSKALQNIKRKESKAQADDMLFVESGCLDSGFEFIAGHTANGFPYGI